jgi:hypothetical protein
MLEAAGGWIEVAIFTVLPDGPSPSPSLTDLAAAYERLGFIVNAHQEPRDGRDVIVLAVRKRVTAHGG